MGDIGKSTDTHESLDSSKSNDTRDSNKSNDTSDKTEARDSQTGEGSKTETDAANNLENQTPSKVDLSVPKDYYSQQTLNELNNPEQATGQKVNESLTHPVPEANNPCFSEALKDQIHQVIGDIADKMGFSEKMQDKIADAATKGLESGWEKGLDAALDKTNLSEKTKEAISSGIRAALETCPDSQAVNPNSARDKPARPDVSPNRSNPYTPNDAQPGTQINIGGRF